MTIIADSLVGKCSPIRPIVQSGQTEFSRPVLEAMAEVYHGYISRKTKGGKLSTPKLVRILDDTIFDDLDRPVTVIETLAGSVQRVQSDRITYYDYEGEGDESGEGVALEFLIKQGATLAEHGRVKRHRAPNGSRSSDGYVKSTYHRITRWLCLQSYGTPYRSKIRPNIARKRGGGTDRSRKLNGVKHTRMAVAKLFARIDKRIDKGLPIDHTIGWHDDESSAEEKSRRARMLADRGKDFFVPDTPRGMETSEELTLADYGLFVDTPTRVTGETKKGAKLNVLSADPENWDNLEKEARRFFDRRVRLAKQTTINKKESRGLAARKKSRRKIAS